MTIYHGAGGGGDATSDIELNALTTLTATATAAATAADASKTAAAASAASAASSYDSFDDRYLGSKTADPTSDNDGNALLTGALYFNSTENVMKVYTGAVWGAVSVPASGLLTAVNPSYTGTLTGGTGVVNLGSGQFYKDASGNVGIGTASPGSYGKFVSKQAADTGIASLGLVAQASSTDTNVSMGYNSTSDTCRLSASYISTGAFKPLSFWTSDTERARIDTSGNLLVGTPSKGSNTGLLHVAGLISGNAVAGRQGLAGTSNGNGINFWWSGSALQAWVDSTNIGDVTIVSDYRLKKKIETQNIPALERVLQLRPITYEFKDYSEVFKADGVAREGFIAHELQAIIPSAVEGEKDAPDQIQSLKLDALCSVLVKAIQEQQALITALTTRITALENK
jgi:hypothetical protein